MPENQLIFIEKNILSQIEEVIIQKSKYRIYYHCAASKGNTHYLLRKCAKTQGHHKPSKKYKIDAAKLQKDDEANRKKSRESHGILYISIKIAWSLFLYSQKLWEIYTFHVHISI